MQIALPSDIEWHARCACARSETRSAHQRALRAVEDNTSPAAAHVRSFGDALIGEVKGLLPILSDAEEFDETILASVAAIRPYLHQLAELARFIARFSQGADVWDRLLGVVEQLGQLTLRRVDDHPGHSWAYDAAKMVAHDTFLSALAIALEEERFDLANRQFVRSWLLNPSDGSRRPSTTDFTAFREHLKSLERRNQRLGLRRISVLADIVKEAHDNGALPCFESLMQADFVCYLRGQSLGEYHGWYPETLVYASDRFTPFSIFARSESAEYLTRLMPVLGVTDLAGIRNLITQTQGSQRNSRLFDCDGLPTQYLANLEHLGIRP